MGGALPIERLLTLVAASLAGSNRMLADLANGRGRAAMCAARAPFVFSPGRGLPRQAIAADCFHRDHTLVLDVLELTVYGHCVLRRSSWAGAAQPAFAPGRPPLWRRLLRPGPLLALQVRAHAGAVTVTVYAAAPGMAPPARADGACILLGPALQEVLLRSHREHRTRWPIAMRIGRWMRG